VGFPDAPVVTIVEGAALAVIVAVFVGIVDGVISGFSGSFTVFSFFGSEDW
jgi:ABC-type dipeptide/oligopeptide/nickel transport system permease subunit